MTTITFLSTDMFKEPIKLLVHRMSHSYVLTYQLDSALTHDLYIIYNNNP